MRDLGNQIQEYVDRSATSISIEEVTQPGPVRLDVASKRRPPHTWWLASAAAIAVIALVAGVVAIVRDEQPAGQLEAGPTNGSSNDTDWLTMFGTETPMPPIPDGWKVLDFADFRFAVPEAWQVPISESCAQEALGIVLASTSSESQAQCGPEHPLPPSVVRLSGGHDADPIGAEVSVGTLTARLASQLCPTGCPDVYEFDNGYHLSVSGSKEEDVLATVTDSGSRRALQDGPIADTSGWRRVEYEGVTFNVPPTWESVDLLESYSSVTNPDGGPIRQSGQLNPGTCGGGLFSDEPPSIAYLGESPIRPSCPSVQSVNLEPADGIWIRPISEETTGALGVATARGATRGLDVTVMGVDESMRTVPYPVVDLVVRGGSKPLWITLGVGVDASTARAILRSVESA